MQDSGQIASKSTMERVLFETTIQYVTIEGYKSFDFCNDLSAGGIYLRTKLPFEIDDTIKLSFSIPKQEVPIPISCEARIAWTNNDTNRCKPVYPCGVGLQFLDMSSTDRASLTEFIAEYDDAKKMNVLCAWCGCCLGLRKGPFGTTSHGICSECRKNLEQNITF